MRRALLLLLLTGAACSDISREASQARSYQCDPDSPLPQCPGGWLCTRNGFCADPDAGRELKCTTSRDCTGGWMCTRDGFCADPDAGLPVSCQAPSDCPGPLRPDGGRWLCAQTQRCVDPDLGQPLPCRDSADCPGRWICGLLKQCLDPDAGAAWPCQSRADCTAGWECGLNGVCYDRAVAKAVACARDAGTEFCAPGWRCGLDELCHDTSVGAPLRCERNDDCDQDWRCASTGRCVDFSNDSLLPTSDAGPASRLPTWLPDDVELLAAARVNAGTGEQRAVALWANDTLTLAFMDTNGVPALDGGASPGAVFKVQRPGVSALTFSPRQAGRDEPFKTWLAVDAGAGVGGGLELYEFSLGDGGLPSAAKVGGLIPLSFIPTSLRWIGPPGRSTKPLAAFDGTTLQLWFEDGGMLSDAGVWRADAGVQITDVNLTFAFRPDAGLELPGGRLLDMVLVSSSHGLFGADFDAGFGASNWGFLDLGDNRSPPRIERLVFTQIPDPSGSQAMTITVLAAIMDYEPSKPGLELLSFPYTRTGSRLTLAGAPRTRLPIARIDGHAPNLVLGSGLDGGTTLVTLDVSPKEFPRSGGRLSGDGAEEIALLDGEFLLSGATSFLSSVPTTGLVPWTPGTARSLCGGGRRVELRFPAASAMQQAGACRFGGDGYLWCERSEPEDAYLPVAGAQDWCFAGVDANLIDTLRSPRGLNQQASRFSLGYSSALSSLPDPQPRAAAAAPAPDGGTLVVFGVNDQLFKGIASAATEQTPQAPRGQDIFRFAVTPLPGGRITSIAMGSPAPDARLASGALVAAGRAFTFKADNEVVWRTAEVVLSAAEAVHTWSDAGRLRVLFRDGSAVALPSQVALAPPLQSGATVVLDATSACGETFVLTASGLFQLQATPQGTGAWGRVPITGLQGPLASVDLAQGRLYASPLSASQGELLLLLPRYASQRLTFPCTR